MRVRRILVIAIAASAVGMSGCVMPDQVNQIQRDIGEVQQDIREIRKNQDEAQVRMEALETNLKSEDPESISRPEFADLKLRLEDNARQLAVLTEQVVDANRRLDRLSSDVTETRELVRLSSNRAIVPAGGDAPADMTSGETAEQATVAPDTAFRTVGEDVVPDAEALFNTAYADFSKGNYALAISGFEEYAERFSSTPLADNALYWIGECHYSQADFTGAIEALDRMLERYPDSDKAAAADLKKGMAYLENNAIAEAIVQLQHVVATYPSTDEARIAREKLVSLGAPVA